MQARTAARPCDTLVVRIAALVLAIVVATVRGGAAETIQEIVVEDNKKTTADTVELISKIEVGDDWSPEMSDKIKQDLVSSGLFKDVEVFWEPCGPSTRPACADAGVRVHILAKDKHSWVIAPTFYNQPTNTGGGVGFGENNLFGLNQKLLLYGQIATGDSFFVGAWVIPAIGGSRFSAQFDTLLKSARNIEYASPHKFFDYPKQVRESRIHYLNAGFKLGVELFRGVRIESRIRAARLSYQDVRLAKGAKIEDVTGDPTTDPSLPVTAPGKEGWDISNEWVLMVDRRANWYGISKGYKYTASFEQALPSLGSDFHYYYAGMGLFRAWQVLEQHNLIIKASLGYGHQLPFQQEYTVGGTSMRGYLNNQFRGDFKTIANLEYSVPLFTISGLSVRGLAFFDSAYTTFLTTSNPERNYLPDARRDQQPVLAPFKNAVGVGTRLYLRQIVLPLLGLDIGYGLEARELQVYLAIGLTD